MISKGNQRSGGQHLATHLMNEFDNETVEIAELRDCIAEDLHGAFAEWRVTAGGTRCKKYLYSLSVNPDHRQGEFRREQYFDFISRVEDKLGLTGQPRAVVFHKKNGREHAHIVWSRIDIDQMKAVQLSQDWPKLKDVARAFARDHDLILPPGLRDDKKPDRFKDREDEVNLTEKQQDERTGISKKDRQDAVSAAWESTNTGRAFIQALDDRGYYIARGQRRAYVIIDRFGEIHSLTRQVKGVKAGPIKDRLSGYPPEVWRAATEVQEAVRAQALASGQQTKEDFATQAAHATYRLDQAQKVRRAKVDMAKSELLAKQQHERKDLKETHKEAESRIWVARELRQRRRQPNLLLRVLGIEKLRNVLHIPVDTMRHLLQRRELAGLTERHKLQICDFDRQYRNLDQIDAYERASLHNKLLRAERTGGKGERDNISGRGDGSEKPLAPELGQDMDPRAKAALERAAEKKEHALKRIKKRRRDRSKKRDRSHDPDRER